MKAVDPRVHPALVPSGSKAVLLAENQKEFTTLPSIRTPLGQVITRWELSPEERDAVAQGEDIYITLLSHGAINPFAPCVGLIDWTVVD